MHARRGGVVSVCMHTLNSADVRTSRLAPKAMRSDCPVESSAKTALKDCLKMLPVYDSDMTT